MEYERVVAVFTGVKFSTLGAVVVEPAGVMDCDALSGSGYGAFADGAVFVLEAAGGGVHGESFDFWGVRRSARGAGLVGKAQIMPQQKKRQAKCLSLWVTVKPIIWFSWIGR